MSSCGGHRAAVLQRSLQCQLSQWSLGPRIPDGVHLLPMLPALVLSQVECGVVVLTILQALAVQTY